MSVSQYDIHKWLNRNFPDITLPEAQLLLTEEVGELSRAILKREQKVRGTAAEWETEAYKEIGDVLIALSHVASLFGFDLEDVLQDRWTTISKRDYLNNPQQHGIDKS